MYSIAVNQDDSLHSCLGLLFRTFGFMEYQICTNWFYVRRPIVQQYAQVVCVGLNDNDKFDVFSFYEYLKGYNDMCFSWKSF